MTDSTPASLRLNWKDITTGLLKIGTMAYGGPAIMGIMQAELQEKRQWLSKERFMEALSLVNLLPGAGATQLGIFLGYARGGWWGGLLAGLCFILPAFFIMMALTVAYATVGGTPLMRGALYGLGPVVLGIFSVAVYRLGRNTITGLAQILIALAAAAAVAMGPFGLVVVLALAGGLGIFLFHSRQRGGLVLVLLMAVWLYWYLAAWPLLATPVTIIGTDAASAGLLDIGIFFFKVGAFSFGGGLTMIAFVQEQVVNQFHWLTPREFVDGLALGQFTPGPILMVAAYVGYKLAGFAGGIVGAVAIFLPSFVLMLSILPAFDRMRQLQWMKAALKGIGPAVIGMLTVSLAQMAPHAVPDTFAIVLFAFTVVALLAWRVSSIKVMLGGALLGVLRDRLAALPGLRAVF
ncbi:MAG: chromate efflux transporter [Gammaproteobacteria bacterium]|nr:chromate efflux transporter [Gammaproteobacteria bacterium]